MAASKLPSLRFAEVVGFLDSCCPFKGQALVGCGTVSPRGGNGEKSASGTSFKTLVKQGRMHACCSIIQKSARTTGQG